MRRRSLRRRITLSATVVVGIALIVGAVLAGVLLRFSLVEQLRASAEADAEQTASLIEDSGLPAELQDVEDGFVQVLAPDGRVLLASDDLEDAGAVDVPEGESATVRLPGEDGEFLVASEEADDLVIVVGRSLDGADETLGTVVMLLLIAVPLLIVLVSGTTWLVVGRALRPVERMRREVDEVTATNLHSRLAVPSDADEIARLAGTMNSMLDRLERSQHAQRQFISDASHELKSPLASLRQYAEVATVHPDRITPNELAEAILDEGSRLERLVQGMLLLARADENALEASRTAVDLDDLVLREAKRLRDSTSLTVSTSEVGAARVRGDEGLLGQIARNLIDNAARHARAHVALSLGRSDIGAHHEVVLAVDDDGDGVPPEERGRVFERFVRLDEARARDSGGSGLGLAIARELARAHGGDVTVGASPLGGARFEVRLPAAFD
jgi:signal transduction histidine kinase